MKKGKRIVAVIIVLSMLFAQQPTIAGDLWKEEKQNTTLETIKESESEQNTQKQEDNVKQEIDNATEITETYIKRFVNFCKIYKCRVGSVK